MLSRVLLFIAVLPAVVHAREPRDFTVAPPAAWVERVAVDPSLHVAKEHVRWGIYDFLSDAQTRVTARETTHYYRTVRKVLSPSGVQNASELSIDFDPTFERLVLHEAAILRDGERLDALEPDEIRVIEKEDDAGMRIYDGELTALVFLVDVRPGDTIEYSWSIVGANPLLGARFVDEFELSSAVPTRQLRQRLVWPAGRPLQWSRPESRIERAGGEQIVVWERTNVPALDVEDSIPSWYEPWESVQLSEFASWAEVAQWAEELFRLDERSRIEVKKLAETIRAKHATHDARVTAAIRFVQDDIRYLGIEMGRNSHEPHQPWETLMRRWGDCKDKTLLLCALLRELGVEAYPALVNTKLQHRLAERLPSPFNFDHVIAQVLANGKTYWVDGTIADQGGTLQTIDTPSDGRALVVRADARALTTIVTRELASTTVEQTYTTTDYARPTILEVRTTYSGSDADSVRAALASMSLADVAKERINHYATDQPKIDALTKPQVRDDRARNVIVITEKYRIRELWKEGEWTWYPRLIESHLQRPETMIRTMPLAFDYPLNVTQTVTVNLPARLRLEPASSVTETPAFRHEYTVDSSGRTVFIRQSLRARKDFVPAKEVPEHLSKLNDVWDEIGYSLRPTTTKSAAAKPVHWAWGLGAVLVLVGVCVGLTMPRRRRELPAAAVMPRGDAPASAFAIRDASEITLHLDALACACGASIETRGETQRARYDERELTIVTRHCGRCGREQSVYFTAMALADSA